MQYIAHASCGKRLEFLFGQGEAVESLKITAPSGVESVLEPFVNRPVRFLCDENGLEVMESGGEDHLCCRYTPLEPGEYTCAVYAGGLLREMVRFTASGPSSRGCIGVSQRDSRYFAYSDGTPFLPIGINLVRPESWTVSNGSEFGQGKSMRTMGIRQYDLWFRRCAGNGVNMARLWLGDPYFSPDTDEAGVFRPEQYAKLDAIFELARKYGIVLKLTIEQFRFMDYTREPNPGGSFEDRIFALFSKRLRYDGYRCDSTQEWLREERWRVLWLLKVRELAKRYAGDPSLFAVELWNEMNCVQADSADTFLDWNRDMLPRVKALFSDNMVINSLGSLDADGPLETYRLFCWDRCDFKQLHRYFDRGAGHKECGEDPVQLIQRGMALLHDDTKPLLVAETGAVNNCHSGPYLYYAQDDRGILFADTVYTPLFCGAAGCGNIWHWDVYVQQKNLYGMFAPLRALTDGIAFDEEAFVTEDLSDGKLRVLLLRGNRHILGYIRNRDDNWRTNFVQGLPPVPSGGEYSLVEGKLTAVPIWADETAHLTLEGGTLRVEDLRYGMMFRIYL